MESFKLIRKLSFWVWMHSSDVFVAAFYTFGLIWGPLVDVTEYKNSCIGFNGIFSARALLIS